MKKNIVKKPTPKEDWTSGGALVVLACLIGMVSLTIFTCSYAVNMIQKLEHEQQTFEQCVQGCQKKQNNKYYRSSK